MTTQEIKTILESIGFEQDKYASGQPVEGVMVKHDRDLPMSYRIMLYHAEIIFDLRVFLRNRVMSAQHEILYEDIEARRNKDLFIDLYNDITRVLVSEIERDLFIRLTNESNGNKKYVPFPG